MAPSYRTKNERYAFNGRELTIRSLLDKQQFDDPEGAAALLGISSATWSLFGNVWPSGLVLADLVSHMELEGLNILELGCGLGIASLVALARGARITSTDYHPLAAEFLEENCRLNGLRPPTFARCDWAIPLTTLGRFDLVMASDVLYEPDHPGLVAGFADAHAAPLAQVLLIDPGRDQRSRFHRQMLARGYGGAAEQSTAAQWQQRGFRGHVLRYARR